MYSNYYSVLLLIYLISLISENQLWAQQYKQYFTRQNFTAASGDSILYRFLIPDGNDSNKKYPLVILLHGIGERGDNNESQLVHGAKAFATPEARKNYPAFVMVPQCPKGKSWSPFRTRNPKLGSKPTKTMDLLLGAVQDIMKNYNIDPDRLYVTGLSMGGFGVFDIMMRHPDMVAAAAVVCGGGDTAFVSQIKDIPLWMFHGANDNIVDPSFSHTMIDALEQQGGTPRYTEYPGVSHDSWNNAYAETELLPWLFSQKKK